MIYSGNRILAPHPKPWGLRALAPSVQVFSDPIAAAQPTQPPRPAIGQMPSYQCPPPYVPYGAYIDPAGNYEYPGCMLPKSGAPVSTPQSATPTIPAPAPPVSPSVSASGSTASATSTITSTNGTAPGTTEPPNDLLLYAAIVVLGLVVLS